MPLSSDELTSAIEYLRSVLANKKERLRRELDYPEKRDAVLAMKDRYPGMSDDQIHEIMRRADE
jgi:hypothetical protein